MGKTVLEWTDECESAFIKLKELLLSPKLLAYPNYKSDKPLELHVDASLTGAGAVLSQCQLGINRPIAFISTTFGQTEASYSSTARELAGLRWAVKKLSAFLRGREFIIHTDHQPLVYLSNTKCISNRLARTLEDLADFTFKVHWVPVESNVVADALSRMHEKTTQGVISEERVDPLGGSLAEIKVEGGGDSLVKCFALWLYGSESRHLEIRETLVTELLNNQKKYGLILNKAEKFKLKILKQEGMLLIPEAIQAFANIFQCEVIVFEKQRNPLYFGEKSNKICYLNSFNNLHYNWLCPKKVTAPAVCIINRGTKINFDKWSHAAAQIIQKENNQIRTLRRVIVSHLPGVDRVQACKSIPELRIFVKYINELHISENLVVREFDVGLPTNRFVILLTLSSFIQGAIEVHCARSHAGRNVLHTALREFVWHPSDWSIVADICQTCQVCQRFKNPVNVADPGFKKIISKHPFALISTDLINFTETTDHFKHCLVVIDHFSKFMVAVPLKNKTAETVVHALQHVVFERLLQLPIRILSDHGPEYDNKLYREMLVKFNIQPIYSSPHHPESNGGVERGNQTLKNLLALYSGKQVDWVRQLPEVVRCYNSNVHATTRRSPNNFFLDKANSLVPLYNPELNPSWKEPSNKFVPFILGQLVGKRILYGGHLVSTKFAPKFEGPFKITHIYSNECSYDIEKIANELSTVPLGVYKVHHVHLKPWIGKPNYLAAYDLSGQIFPPIKGKVSSVPIMNKKPMYADVPSFGGGLFNSSMSNSSSESFKGFINSSVPTLDCSSEPVIDSLNLTPISPPADIPDLITDHASLLDGVNHNFKNLLREQFPLANPLSTPINLEPLKRIHPCPPCTSTPIVSATNDSPIGLVTPIIDLSSEDIFFDSLQELTDEDLDKYFEGFPSPGHDEAIKTSADLTRAEDYLDLTHELIVNTPVEPDIVENNNPLISVPVLIKNEPPDILQPDTLPTLFLENTDRPADVPNIRASLRRLPAKEPGFYKD
ncbi:unnamed protein product [Rotaria socialis]|uniref:Integrase catalytic domain-containing protein n=1 Tax=Rotaria socialis TaxID=392032 RepID=A0A821TCU9_9BILA|nr:unnamed protein product [Rotaria socialis]CAF4874313.1 unnamed protein product [Rotaria socialis]